MPTKIEQPAPLEPATSDDFAEALSRGDAFEVANILRRLDALGPAELGVLADLLMDEPATRKLFRFGLKFVRRQGGRPSSDQMQKAYDDARIRDAFDRALAEFGKWEAAIQEAMKSTKFKRTRITEALKGHKPKK
jgi:hypothetical protein